MQGKFHANLAISLISVLSIHLSMPLYVPASPSGSPEPPPSRVATELLELQPTLRRLAEFGTQHPGCDSEVSTRRPRKGLSLATRRSFPSLNSLNAVDPTPENWDDEMNTLQDRIWVDLSPTGNYKFSNTQNDLAQIIDLYHKQEKSNPGYILFRKKLLEKIDQLCRLKLQSPDLSHEERTKLQLISQTAMNKHDYLNELKNIKQNTFQIVFPTPGSDLNHARLGRNYVVEEKETDKKWELLEHLDPALRSREYLGPLFQDWKKEVSLHENTPSFFYWLEGQEISQYRSQKGLTQDSELESGTTTRVVNFEKGKATSQPFLTRNPKVYSKNSLKKWHDQENDPITHDQVNFFSRDDQKLSPNEPSSALHYVIDRDGTLYIRHKSPYHSYILRGKPVVSAGNITFKDGKIDSIDNESGHYTPSNKLLHKAIELLRRRYGDQQDRIFTDQFKMTQQPSLKELKP